MLRIFLFFISLCFITGCVSKKYTRHFQNHTNSIATYEPVEISEKSELLVYAREYKTPPPNKKVQFDSLVKKETVDKSLEVIDSLSQEAENSKPLKKSKETKRRLEPLGIGGFILGALGAIGILITIYTGAWGGLAIAALILGAILGIVSLSRIKKNKEKWKGKGFGIMAIVFLGALIVSFSLILMIMLSSGYS